MRVIARSEFGPLAAVAVDLVGIVIAAAAVLLIARSRSERGKRTLSAG